MAASQLRFMIVHGTIHWHVTLLSYLQILQMMEHGCFSQTLANVIVRYMTVLVLE
jgi:hypothetical protein